jgi:hypothetical protein
LVTQDLVVVVVVRIMAHQVDQVDVAVVVDILLLEHLQETGLRVLEVVLVQILHQETVGVAVEVWEARVQTLILQILVGGVMVLCMLLLARM